MTRLSAPPTPRKRAARTVLLPDAPTLAHVLRAQATIYNDCRTGKLASKEGSRLTYLLAQVRTTIESLTTDAKLSEVLRRLDDMERTR